MAIRQAYLPQKKKEKGRRKKKEFHLCNDTSK
jgi:hypothetical protein